jgi:hypothetical protein
MFLSAKYVIFYTASGLATGLLSKGNKTALFIGVGISALAGASFGLSYAAVSGIEFAVGFGLAFLLQSEKKGD